jgi:hypothetical protein
MKIAQLHIGLAQYQIQEMQTCQDKQDTMKKSGCLLNASENTEMMKNMLKVETKIKTDMRKKIAAIKLSKTGDSGPHVTSLSTITCKLI